MVIATPTASGKSLCTQLPIAEAVTGAVRPGTALALFPTKALAYDQLRSWLALGVPGVVPAPFDGDCSADERTWAREHANVLLTNPEMLHYALLPGHKRWAPFLGRLRYVVVDELHVLRGVFGSHVAHVLRRLLRLCHRYGSDPTLAFCSATIGEPAKLASELGAGPVIPITDDGSPRGDRYLAVWDPALGDSCRVQLEGCTVEVVADLLDRGLRTLVFCRSRRATELVASALQAARPERAIRAYRAGHLPEERRAVEDALTAGDVDAVVATTALELGLDVGGLDAVVLSGFPGTTASMWQQAGRAGRGPRPALAILVTDDDQLDRWVARHPAEAVRRPPEPAVVNVANPLVADAQLACAATEMPLTLADERYWGELLHDAVRRGVQGDRMQLRRRRFGEPMAVWRDGGWPSRGVSLRSASNTELRIEDPDGELVGTIDADRAFEQVHPGAVYLHQGRAWRVQQLDPADRVVLVQPDDGDTFTSPVSTTEVRVARVDSERTVAGVAVGLGPVEVTRRVVGYRERRLADRRTIDRVPLELPAATMTTRAFWWRFDDAALEALGGPAAPALHATEHLATALLPIFTLCDRRDVGGVSNLAGAPVLVFDASPGGAGIAELGFAVAEAHLAAALDLAASCACDCGCPSCVQSPVCSTPSAAVDRHGARLLLASALTRPGTPTAP